MKKIIIWAVIILAILSAVIIYSFDGFISKSHIEGNTPDKDVFDKYLERDLTTYFSKTNNTPITVKYEMLNKEPYQAGLGVPKYYIWVVVTDKDSNKQINEGVAYIGANNKTEFTIIDFTSKDELIKDRDGIKNKYPETVYKAIEERI